MGDRVSAHFVSDFDQALGDERPRDRSAKQILALVQGVGAEHREDVVAHEFLAHVLDEDVLRLDAEQLSLFARRLQFLALAEIGGGGDDLGAVFGLQPLEDDRRVQPTRIGEDDALDLRLLGARHGWQDFLQRKDPSWPGGGPPPTRPAMTMEGRWPRNVGGTYRAALAARNPASAAGRAPG